MKRSIIKMYYTYILKSINYDKLYIGSTENLRQRLGDHNSSKSNFTKSFMPWKLVYYEAHISKTFAIKAENFYKTGQGRRQIKRKLGINQ